MKTIKLYLCIAIIAGLGFSSCSHQPSYTINGTVAQSGLEGKQVVLTGCRGEYAAQHSDSTVILNGKYTFKGYVESPDCYKIVIDPEERDNAISITFVLENAKITANTDAEGISTISGTAYNDAYQRYLEEERGPAQKIKDYYGMINAGTFTAETAKSMGEEQARRTKLQLDFIQNNLDNPAAWVLLPGVSVSLPLEQQKELVSLAQAKNININEFAQIADRVRALEKTSIGQPFSNLSMVDPDGNAIQLSDYAGKGKYVLVDFWASWCGPCRAEMPDVIAVYDKYKDKGFEVVGVSFDSSHSAWLKAIEELGLPWVQMSDLKGWDSDGAKIYVVTGVPHTILIDPQGIIIAKNLRGKGLHRELAELLK